MTRPYPDDFYGVVDVPFHRFLDVIFERSGPFEPATIRLPAAAGLARLPAEVFAVAEIGAAIEATDAIWDHVADTELRPMLLTTGVSIRHYVEPTGELRAASRFIDDTAQTFQRLIAKRKARCTVAVDVRDETDQLVADARAELYLRLMSPERWAAMLGSERPVDAETAVR